MNDHYRERVIDAVRGLPTVLDGFLNGLTADDSRWDMHPEPDRFSLREIVAHLADADAIWVERLTALRDQDNPTLRPFDESALAIANDYAHADTDVSRAKLYQRRQEVLRILRGLAPGDWCRPGRHPMLGEIVLADQAKYIALHDSYHTQQVARWLMSFQVPAPA